MSGRPLSVLLHARAFYPQIGGLERVTEHLARELTHLGVQVTVLTDTPLGKAAELGPYRVVRSADASARETLVRSVDVVHVNGFSVQLARLATPARKPILWTHQGYQAVCTEGSLLHGGSSCYGRLGRCAMLSARHRGWLWAVRHGAGLAIRRALLRAATANVCVSAWVASRIRAPRSRVIWNPVDVCAPVRGEKSQNQDRFSFLGRLVSEKGAAVLLEALRLCRGAGHAFTACLVGDGPERARLEAEARRAGIAEAVEFKGALVGEALRRTQGEAWVCVVPSIWEEAMGLVAVEAMAAGTPLIVSRDGGLLEVARGCTLDFRNGDAQELASAMVRMSNDGALWRNLAAAGPERARLFDARTIAGRYAQLYEEALA